MEFRIALGAKMLTINLFFCQSSLWGRRDSWDSSLWLITNHGTMVPLFVLHFPISGAISLKTLPQKESPEQFFYGVPWNSSSTKFHLSGGIGTASQRDPKITNFENHFFKLKLYWKEYWNRNSKIKISEEITNEIYSYSVSLTLLYMLIIERHWIDDHRSLKGADTC